LPRFPAASRLALALIAGLAAGAVTEALVLRVSFDLVPLTNTAAPWVLVAFVVALTARRIDEAVILAVVTLLALVLGFYLAQATRGWAVSRHQIAFWLLASFVAGPLVGLAAGWLRHGGPVVGGIGAGIVGGVLVGEAVHGIRDLTYSSPHTYWRVQLALGIALTVGLTLWRCRRDLLAAAPALAAALASCAAVGIATLIANQLP
jgi:Family of unknown function (DUF6518)